MWGSLISHTFLVGSKMMDMQLPYNWGITLLDTYLRVMKKICSQKNLCIYVHKSPKLETVQMVFNGWMRKQMVAHPCSWLSLSRKKELTDFHNDWWFSRSFYWVEKATGKGYTVWFHLHEFLQVKQLMSCNAI